MVFGLERTLLRGQLGRALKECRKHFLAAAAFSALANVLYLAPTLYMIQVYDRAMPTGGVVTLAGLTVVVVVSLAVLAAMEWMRSRVLVRAGARLDRLLAGPVLSALLASTSLKPEARAQAMREFDLFRQVLAGPGLLAALDVPWAPIYVIAASLLSPLLGVAALASALLLLGLAWLNESATRRPLQQANEAAGATYAAQNYVSASAGAVRALGMREALVQKQIADRRMMTDLQVQASMSASAYVAGLKAARLILQSAALGLAAYLAIKGQISAGAIFAASFLLTRTLAPVEHIVGSWKSIVLARSAHRKLTDLLDAGETGEAQTLLPAPTGHLTIEHVSLKASPDRPPILEDGRAIR